MLLAEASENTCRRGLLLSEKIALAESLLPYARDMARRRQSHNVENGTSDDSPEAGEALEIIGFKVGLARQTLARALSVVAAGREDPAAFGDLARKMDESGKVQPSYRELRRRKGLLKEKPREPDEIEGVSIHTNRKGGIRITISEDRPDGNALLKLFRAAVETFSADHPEGTRR